MILKSIPITSFLDQWFWESMKNIFLFFIKNLSYFFRDHLKNVGKRRFKINIIVMPLIHLKIPFWKKNYIFLSFKISDIKCDEDKIR